jgi:hypothetical protein
MGDDPPVGVVDQSPFGELIRAVRAVEHEAETPAPVTP